jgi:hypothetical protein
MASDFTPSAEMASIPVTDLITLADGATVLDRYARLWTLQDQLTTNMGVGGDSWREALEPLLDGAQENAVAEIGRMAAIFEAHAEVVNASIANLDLDKDGSPVEGGLSNALGVVEGDYVGAVITRVHDRLSNVTISGLEPELVPMMVLSGSGGHDPFCLTLLLMAMEDASSCHHGSASGCAHWRWDVATYHEYLC